MMAHVGDPRIFWINFFYQFQAFLYIQVCGVWVVVESIDYQVLESC